MCALVHVLTHNARARTHMKIHKHTEAILHPETSGNEEEAPSGRSRFYTRSLCAVRPRMGNEGIGGMRSLDTEPVPDVAKQNMAPRDNPASAKRSRESAQCVCITLRGTCRVMLK